MRYVTHKRSVIQTGLPQILDHKLQRQMTLHSKKSVNGTAVILDVIREMSGGTTYTAFDAIITATINGIQKINNETIRVHLTNSRPNYALIDIMWEDYGYKNYLDMGLFGRMSTQWQEVTKIASRKFRVFSDKYQVDITY